MQITAKSLLASFIALLLVLTLSPFVAYADETVLESTPQEYDVEIGPTLDSTSDPQKENSYRFENGERITSEDGAATDTESILSTFSAVVNPEGYTVFNWFDKFSKGYYTGTNAYKGIDVSEHNGTINWKTVKASGVDYAIIRCGYGQNSKSQDDDQWINNVRGCINNGIPFGVYIYSYATNTTRAASEADHVLRCLKDAGLNPSKVGYPIYFDMELPHFATRSRRPVMFRVFMRTRHGSMRNSRQVVLALGRSGLRNGMLRKVLLIQASRTLLPATVCGNSLTTEQFRALTAKQLILITPS